MKLLTTNHSIISKIRVSEVFYLFFTKSVHISRAICACTGYI